MLGRAGTQDSLDSKSIPLFDRFFLGGPNSLRGFGYRDIGPADATGEPLGGNSFGFMSVEYGFRVIPQLELAMFYDGGFLNSGTADFSFDDYNDNWGVGLRLLVLGAPLRIDYGIPMNSSGTNKKSNQFYFSFGTRF